MTERKNFRDVINKNWLEVFDEIDKDIFEITEDSYNEVIQSKKNIFPTFKNIFNFTNYCIPEEIKVVILGQDPYHGTYYSSKNKTAYPQAMGLSFSVPNECTLPPSLENIYSNLVKYKHFIKKPFKGNLEFWAHQGVLMLNTSLTVEQAKPNSHQNIWFEFTNELIKILSTKFKNLIFVLWGANAFEKKRLIKNQDSHKFIISSHPSPLSAFKPFKNYGKFVDIDHFGLINQYIDEFNNSTEFKQKNKRIEPIVWLIV